ncbi:hypothetical protein BJ165DRAFT_1415359 [Panaeolus papilionaceus]|nr:hypothetical protein BJ165DRAFT_1415359 [Panaeolus papilionaceus]
MTNVKEQKNQQQQEQANDNDANSDSSPLNDAGTSPSKNDGNEASTEPEASSSSTPAPAPQNQWQAVWAPQYNAYYFYNSVTQETTWVNPLQPGASSGSASTSATDAAEGSGPPQDAERESPEAGPSTSARTNTTQQSAYASHHAALEAAALAQGIDPALAHLDPSLLAPAVPGSSFTAGGLPTFQAKFNNRTGQFTAANSRTPGHLSEHERAKRMSEFYFDVNQWEQQLAEQGGSIMGDEEDGEGGKKRKRPTKKDLERFKEQKKAKKIAKTAWLRS